MNYSNKFFIVIKLKINFPIYKLIRNIKKTSGPCIDDIHEGWDHYLGIQTYSWADLWVKRFSGTEFKYSCELPKGVELPTF